MKAIALKCAIATSGGIFTYLFGGVDAAAITLFVFIILDYITGVFGAIINKSLSSSVGLKGILRKLAIISCVIVAVLLDRLLNTEDMLRTMFCYFMIANEGLSILENAAKMGIPLPEKLIETLKQLKK